MQGATLDEVAREGLAEELAVDLRPECRKEPAKLIPAKYLLDVLLILRFLLTRL